VSGEQPHRVPALAVANQRMLEMHDRRLHVGERELLQQPAVETHCIENQKADVPDLVACQKGLPAQRRDRNLADQ
jgi:hypothetical protein